MSFFGKLGICKCIAEEWVGLYCAFQVACNWAMSCRSSHVIKLKLSSQLIGQFGHVTASASCKQPEKHGSTLREKSTATEFPAELLTQTANVMLQTTLHCISYWVLL